MKMFTMLMVLVFSVASMAADAKQKTYKVGWSNYPSWMLFSFEDVIKKHADKAGVSIKVVKVNDYIESVNLFTSKNLDFIAATNMDLLTIPASSGIDTQVIFVNSTSNGNDVVISKTAKNFKELKGKQVQLVELSVSHYLLARGLSLSGMSEKDVKIQNTSDADLVANYAAIPGVTVTAWNPQAHTIVKSNPGKANVLFDSSKIPGEIIDLTAVHTEVPDAVKQAVVNALVELQNGIKDGASSKAKMVEQMSKEFGGKQDDFLAMLATTNIMFKDKEAVEFMKSPALKQTMTNVRDFSAEKGLFGSGKSKDSVGIQFPDGTVLGSQKNVKMRFTTKYMEATK